jgi:subtilase family serine protease
MRRPLPSPLFVEPLESRQLLSATTTPDGLSPQQVRHAYGFDQVSFHRGRRRVVADGTGETIAIIDAFNDPTIFQDLRAFDGQYGLSNRDGTGAFALSVATPGGRPQDNGDWGGEISLDVEWAHAIAPGAHILLVEAASDSTDDLLSAINYARSQTGVVAVSMSWGGTESPFEQFQDAYLTTPRRHYGGYRLRGGITFVTSSGDAGAQTAWPAASPNCICVGGTTLNVDASGNYLSESAWSGSGGGSSRIEGTNAPDVAYDADPNTGFAVYDSTPDSQGDVGWQVVAGTSAGAPQWAALFAIVDQGRALHGFGSLDGPSQTINAVYAAPQSDFHDITTGNNGRFLAGPGYDLVTGRGSPLANLLIPDLAATT